MWFEKIQNEEHILHHSDVILHEINKTNPELIEKFKKTILEFKGKEKYIKSEENDENEATQLFQQTEFDFLDLLHLVLTKRFNLTAVSADINHWPKIARLLETKVLYITEIYS